jgi:tetraacyldisaccharide 4'-kinase
MENFQAIAEDFRAAEACVEIGGAGELASAVERTLRDPGDVGDRARLCAEAKRGATARAVQEAHAVYRVPRYRPAMPWYAVARVLAALWEWEAHRRQIRDYRQRRRLESKVISIGNLTMGGTGKTPCVLRLAELLRERGRRPAILTRGYGRTSPVKSLVTAPGAAVRVESTGDEAQIFLHSSVAPVGIGADRFETGSLLQQEFGVDVVLLDDGFQHVKLARDLDVLLIDGVNPWSGGHVFPAGRLREPLPGMARAHIIVITRSDETDLVPAISREVRRYNPAAPIVTARVSPVCWVDWHSGECIPLQQVPLGRVAGFCGLGNPQGFRRTLRGLGVEPVDWVEFEDHHRYTPGELQRMMRQFLERGVNAMVTTEKDGVNIARDLGELIRGLPLYWLKIQLRFDGEQDLMDAVIRGIRAE